MSTHKKWNTDWILLPGGRSYSGWVQACVCFSWLSAPGPEWYVRFRGSQNLLLFPLWAVCLLKLKTMIPQENQAQHWPLLPVRAWNSESLTLVLSISSVFWSKVLWNLQGPSMRVILPVFIQILICLKLAHCPNFLASHWSSLMW